MEVRRGGFWLSVVGNNNNTNWWFSVATANLVKVPSPPGSLALRGEHGFAAMQLTAWVIAAFWEHQVRIAGVSPSASRIPDFPFLVGSQPTASRAGPVRPVDQASPAHPGIPWAASNNTNSWRGRGRAGWRGPERGGTRGGWRPEAERGRGARGWWPETVRTQLEGEGRWRPEPVQAQPEGQIRWQGSRRGERRLSNSRINPGQNPLSSSNPGARVARPESPPAPINLREIADEASVLLELFSKTQPADDGDIKDEHRQLIDSASEIILKIQKNLRAIDARKGGNIAIVQPPVSNTDDMKVDIGCIICYSHVADVLLMPCKHLVLCMVCVSLLTFRLV